MESDFIIRSWIGQNWSIKLEIWICIDDDESILDGKSPKLSTHVHVPADCIHIQVTGWEGTNSFYSHCLSETEWQSQIFFSILRTFYNGTNQSVSISLRSQKVLPLRIGFRDTVELKEFSQLINRLRRFNYSKIANVSNFEIKKLFLFLSFIYTPMQHFCITQVELTHILLRRSQIDLAQLC